MRRAQRQAAAADAESRYTRRVRKLRHDDLFVMFPDLPRPRRAGNDGFLSRLYLHVQATRARALANIVRQRARSRNLFSPRTPQLVRTERKLKRTR